jgi:hypothetical protein
MRVRSGKRYFPAVLGGRLKAARPFPAFLKHTTALVASLLETGWCGELAVRRFGREY